MRLRHNPRDGGDRDHHDGEQIVELATVPTRFEADVLVAALEARGIKASAVHGDSSGWAPNLALIVGHRVMVFEGDLATARTILEEQALAAEAVEPSD